MLCFVLRRSRPLPLAGGWGCRRFLDERDADTPTSNSSPQGGGEQRGGSRRMLCFVLRRSRPLPLAGGWGCRRFLDERDADTPTSSSSPQGGGKQRERGPR